jgi:2-polyprenyl-6-methoxyphenol hydroxylase-like FAD-dependent oxidoreductase
MQVLVAEKEPRFRDRVRGDAILPWGMAEAIRLGAASLFANVGAVELLGLQVSVDGEPPEPHRWAGTSVDGLNEVGFRHQLLQEAAFGWAETLGATVRRPMKVLGVADGAGAKVAVSYEGRVEEVSARLVVGADGRLSTARRWTGGQSTSDPDNHRFGGVAVSGVHTDDRATDNVAGTIGIWVNWFAQSAETTRLYLTLGHEQFRDSHVGRSFEALVQVAAGHMPDGALDEVRQEGPIAFFPNADTWATRIVGNDVVLIGDAAGSIDPSQGMGTSLVFRDVRELSDLLLSEEHWPRAIEEYADRRGRYFAVLRQYDLWRNILDMQSGERADLLREGNERAVAADPELGGYSMIEARGPDGLAADAAARARYFGQNV